mmetsp:Transcript_26895/g.69735  ORF Transcript_26895/g.69735 Transcript_26895/m.69735 type:complete len:278 (-) Transcript_26895:187-1020(-)
MRRTRYRAREHGTRDRACRASACRTRVASTAVTTGSPYHLIGGGRKKASGFSPRLIIAARLWPTRPSARRCAALLLVFENGGRTPRRKKAGATHFARKDHIFFSWKAQPALSSTGFHSECLSSRESAAAGGRPVLVAQRHRGAVGFQHNDGRPDSHSDRLLAHQVLRGHCSGESGRYLGRLQADDGLLQGALVEHVGDAALLVARSELVREGARLDDMHLGAALPRGHHHLEQHLGLYLPRHRERCVVHAHVQRVARVAAAALQSTSCYGDAVGMNQ